MSEPTIRVHHKAPPEKVLIYIGYCCREWPMAFGYPPGRCGLCGQAPVFLRWDDEATA